MNCRRLRISCTMENWKVRSWRKRFLIVIRLLRIIERSMGILRMLRIGLLRWRLRNVFDGLTSRIEIWSLARWNRLCKPIGRMKVMIKAMIISLLSSEISRFKRRLCRRWVLSGCSWSRFWRKLIIWWQNDYFFLEMNEKYYNS